LLPSPKTTKALKRLLAALVCSSKSLKISLCYAIKIIAA
jgi:hypothetical protein